MQTRFTYSLFGLAMTLGACGDNGSTAEALVPDSQSISSCQYRCEDYGYAVHQCTEGWYCDGSCITYTGCDWGQTCISSADCSPGRLCQAQQACGTPSVCQPVKSCVRDLVEYCGCDGQTFEASSNCPGRSYEHAGPCTPACQYACDAYNFAEGECRYGWLCEDGCVEYVGTCQESCQYPCASFGYAQGECRDGWLCDAGCITFVGCVP